MYNTRTISPELHKPEVALSLHMRMHIFMGVYRRVYVFCTLIVKIFFVVTTIGSIYGMIRMTGVLAVGLTVIGASIGFFLIFILESWAEYHFRSSQFLQNIAVWNTDRYRLANRCEYLWLRKSLRAIRPIRFQVGSFYFADKQLVLTVVKIIANWAVFLLVNY